MVEQGVVNFLYSKRKITIFLFRRKNQSEDKMLISKHSKLCTNFPNIRTKSNLQVNDICHKILDDYIKDNGELHFKFTS